MTKRLTIGDTAPDITLYDTNNQPVDLSSIWPTGPTMLNFLRHFGCTFCRQSLARLEVRHADLEAVGIQVINIAMGNPTHLERYRERLAPHLHFLARKDDSAHRTYGLKEGNLAQLASFNVATSAIGEFARGNIGGVPSGNVRMMPGMFIVDNGGKITYTYYSKDIADHPTVDQLLTAAKQVRV